MTHASNDSFTSSDPTAAPSWQPSTRSPDPAVVSLHPDFDRLRLSSARVERLSTGHRWCEGPVWWGDARCLLWSDIPNNTIYRWDEITAGVSVWRSPSAHANGATRDRQGRILHCEHSQRRVVRTEHDGSVTCLVDRFEGKPLNSPNDLVCKSDGSVWFTDPSFGISGHYEGVPAVAELPTQVYRWHETEGLSVVAHDLREPNGLAFSPDESILYVVESRAQPKRILAFDVVAGGRALAHGRTHIDAGPTGTPDGLRVDVHGNLWCGWGMGQDGLDGVHVFNPKGERIGRIDLPERCANLCFGGLHRNRLFMAASTSIYALYVNTQGMVGG